MTIAKERHTASGSRPRRKAVTVRIPPERLRRVMKARGLKTQSEVLNTLLEEEEERLRSHRALEELGLARLQNDILLAATARHTGALFLTRDGHFRTIREPVPFRLRWLSSP